jgi:AcrR family transcriptional regulator
MDTYHHGSLRRALIDATDQLLAERGAGGFSLREVARRAGVSPAAPAHHFGDAAGLLSAVATLAFDGLAEALRKGDKRGAPDPRRRIREQGVEYVMFALRHPGRFRLMFGERFSKPGEALAKSGNAAFAVLEGATRDAFGIARGGPLTDEAWNSLLASWSVVHGYAHLAIAGRFDPHAESVSLERFVAKTLRPVLDRVLEGNVPGRPCRASAKRTGPSPRRSKRGQVRKLT